MQGHRVVIVDDRAAGRTLVVPALPFFQREFDTSASWVTWIATGFLLSSSVLTPILGKLGDQYGKERLLLVSLGLFLAGCVGAAFAAMVMSAQVGSAQELSLKPRPVAELRAARAG